MVRKNSQCNFVWPRTSANPLGYTWEYLLLCRPCASLKNIVTRTTIYEKKYILDFSKPQRIPQPGLVTMIIISFWITYVVFHIFVVESALVAFVLRIGTAIGHVVCIRCFFVGIRCHLAVANCFWLIYWCRCYCCCCWRRRRRCISRVHWIRLRLLCVGHFHCHLSL